MPLFTTTTTVGPHVVVSLDGIVDLSSVATLHSDLDRALRQHPGATIVVDLDSAGALDDTALGVLLGTAARARSAGGDLEVVCSRSPLRDRLSATRFDLAITVRASIA
jgi:anti-anti-sigma factor